MRKIILINFFIHFFISFLFSQEGNYIYGSHFTKKIENSSNIESKGIFEKMFFGDSNASVEFFYFPSFDGTSGFRIVRDPLDTSNIFEIKYISNYKDAQNEVLNRYKSIGIPVNLALNITDDIKNLIIEHNKTIHSKQFEEVIKLYKVETISFSVSDQFAEKFYKNLFYFINNFKARKSPPVISSDNVINRRTVILDGYSVLFRIVGDDEVWSLNIVDPQGNALKMSNLCLQIISDALKNEFDESKYMSILNSFKY